MIKIQNLTKKYDDNIIISDVNYEFPLKGLVCILGASGSGKTTLLNLLAGFDSDYEGEITVGSTSLSNISTDQLCEYRRENVGFVFQNYHLLSGYTVLENILLACEFNSDSPEQNKEKVISILDKLGMSSKVDQRIENLSGGQKQRVAMARAIINSPKIIFADEPTGALDRNTSTEIMNLLKKIAEEKLVIVITHDKKICDFADEVITIENGKIKAEQSVDRNHDEPKENVLEPKQTSKIPVFSHAWKNLKVHFKRYIAVSLTISIGICCFMLSLSAGNLMNKYILKFKEENTAFNNGYIKYKDNKDVFDLLNDDEGIENVYYQYKLKDINISYQDKTENILEKIPMPKAIENMSYGTMPRQGKNEIALTPSISKKLANDIKSLVGQEILFELGGSSQKLTVSGIYNAGYDDFFVSSDIEEELYKDMDKQEIFSIYYDVKDFSHIVTISNMLKLKGIESKDASKQVYALQNTFNSLSQLFLILSILIFAIGLFISAVLLVKMQNARYREIGLLSALGFSKKVIGKIIMVENLLLSCMATATNVILMLMVYCVGSVAGFSVMVTPVQLIGAMILTFVIVLSVSILASHKLINTEPAEALGK